MMEPFATVDAWERLKSFVLESDPAAAQAIEDRREADWGVLSTSEAQVLAIMVALDMELYSPVDRRRARRLLGALAAEAEGELLVSEGEDPEPHLDPKRAEDLRKSLRWITENPPSRFLPAIPGPQAAVRTIQRAAPSLTGLGAYRWLVALGYSCAVPDRGRRTWLERMGIMEPSRGRSPTVQQRHTLGALEQLARSVHAPLSEVDTILEIFTGSRKGRSTEAALCQRKPQCPKCPLKAECRYSLNRGAERERETRNLSVIMRDESRPRERLAQHGAAALTEEELLAILLRTGSGGLNAVDVATQMLRTAGSLDRLSSMSLAELAAQKGIGRVKAITIKAALELARRVKSAPPPGRQPIQTSRQIFELVESHFIGAKREEFLVMLLDVKMRFMRLIPVSMGTLTNSIVHPREAFLEAIRDSAHAVIFVHNHPTGDPAPSLQDVAITRRLVEAGEVVGIQVKDHLIIGSGRFYSFADAGKL